MPRAALDDSEQYVTKWRLVFVQLAVLLRRPTPPGLGGGAMGRPPQPQAGVVGRAGAAAPGGGGSPAPLGRPGPPRPPSPSSNT
jgi:hypothetical protein